MEEKEKQEEVVTEAVESEKVEEVEQNADKVEEPSAQPPEQQTVSNDKVKAKKEKKKKEKVEPAQESFEGMSDDEIYTRLQTEKLVQKRKRRRIITAVAMGVAFALALVVIILATVPVSLKPNCIDNNFTEVRFYNGTNIDNPVGAILNDDERFDDFKKVFDKSFAQSCLSALFSGSLFAYDIEENHDTLTRAMNELTSSNTYFVQLTYQTEHKVTKQSGKVYHSNRYAQRDWTFTFKTVYITVNSDAGFRETRVYIPVSYPDSEEGEYAIVITVKANTNKIRQAWADFVSD